MTDREDRPLTDGYGEPDIDDDENYSPEMRVLFSLLEAQTAIFATLMDDIADVKAMATAAFELQKQAILSAGGNPSEIEARSAEVLSEARRVALSEASARVKEIVSDLFPDPDSPDEPGD